MEFNDHSYIQRTVGDRLLKSRIVMIKGEITQQLGGHYLDKGTILKIEKEKRIKYSYWSSMSGLEDKSEKLPMSWNPVTVRRL